MKNLHENALMQEMSLEAAKNVNAGADYVWYNGDNSLVYLGTAIYNAGVSIYNLITGEEAGSKTI